ncbi:MAG: hypothetical protein ACKV2V_30780, partial [Blastocatellia bacterium]
MSIFLETPGGLSMFSFIVLVHRSRSSGMGSRECGMRNQANGEWGMRNQAAVVRPLLLAIVFYSAF